MNAPSTSSSTAFSRPAPLQTDETNQNSLYESKRYNASLSVYIDDLFNRLNTQQQELEAAGITHVMLLPFEIENVENLSLDELNNQIFIKCMEEHEKNFREK